MHVLGGTREAELEVFLRPKDISEGISSDADDKPHRPSLVYRYCGPLARDRVRKHRQRYVFFAFCTVILSLPFLAWLDFREHRATLSCSTCSLAYYTATACVLGGQVLQPVGWERLAELLAPGESFRKELESLLASARFKVLAQCPFWATWDASLGICRSTGRPEACRSAVGSYTSDRKNTTKCSTNLVLQPNESSKRVAMFHTHASVYVAADWCNLERAQQRDWFLTSSGSLLSPDGLCVSVDPNVSWLVGLATCSDIKDQRWTWASSNHVIHSSGLCLHFWRGPVGLWPCEDEDNNYFKLLGGTVQSFNGLCLESAIGDPLFFGSSGGSCTCPDGQVYEVSDMRTDCRTLACWGGEPGACDARSSELGATRYAREVVCQPNFLEAASLGQFVSNPLEDTVCWASLRPLFVWPGFVASCPHFAPSFIRWPNTDDIWKRFDFTAKNVNFKPVAKHFGDFGLFYDMFYQTLAGETCRKQFGSEREGGSALTLTASPPIMLNHSAFGAESFKQQTLLNVVVPAWIDREYSYRNIPGDLLGATFFALLHKTMPSGQFTLGSSGAGVVYVWSEHDRSGGFPNLEWEVVTQVWESSQFNFSVYRHDIAANSSLTFPVQEPWVGGIAFQPKG